MYHKLDYIWNVKRNIDVRIGDEKRLTPLEGMDVIMATLHKTNANNEDSAFRFILWGALISLASFLYFFLQPHTTWYFIPFPFLVFAGVLVTVANERKVSLAGARSYLQFFLSRMWLVLGISFGSVVFISVSQGYVPFTYTLLLAAIGTLVSGVIIEFRPLIISGVLLLSAAIGSIYIPDSYKSLLHGVAIGGGYLIPGYLLKNRKL
ncbi:MAG: hypothetical protein WKF87_13160 [Chryseolinea sp.]